MRNFLEKRAGYISGDFLKEIPVDRFNSSEFILSYLEDIDSFAIAMNEYLEFLSSETPGIEEKILSSLDTLEGKIAYINDTVAYLLRIRNVFTSMSNHSLVNITKGEFKNLDYSYSDKGLILSSSQSIDINSTEI